MIHSFRKFLKELFYYPAFNSSDESYTQYWKARKISVDRVNSFQKKRAELVLKYIEGQSSILDIGCGNGAILKKINSLRPMSRMVGADISDDVLEMTKQNGVEAHKIDIANLNEINSLPITDYVFLFEILEHIPKSEDMLKWAVDRSPKGVFFSVPNTGHIAHRLRLLFGRFPLQWRVRPDEHLRFWTVGDMKWWLAQLGHRKYILRLYEGQPILNKIWPFLFARGIWIYIPRK